RGATLTGEQRAAVIALLTSGNGVEVLVGSPGSGKTYLLDVAREAWQAEGFSVVGGAIAAEAAKGLGDAVHMPSNTVAQMLIDIDRERREGDLVPRPGVVVIDEASMIGSRDLATLVRQLTGAGIKVVLVGDDRQLPAIAAGGLFGDLARQLDPIVLSDNGRQIERWERQAIAAGRMGRADEMVMAYVEHGRVVVAGDRLTLAHRCVEDWWVSRSSGAESVMLARSRADVTMLNRMARVHLEAGGELAGPVLSVPAHRRGPVAEREYQVGDQVRLCHNNRRLAGGVRNGMEGVVRSVDLRTMRITVATTDGRRVVLPADYVRRWTDYAYATTDYKSEGKTVGTGSRARSSGSVSAERAVEGHAFVFDAGSRSAEATAVAASRATTTTHFYALSAQPVTDEGHHRPRPLDVELATERAWRRSAADVTAHEHLRQTDEVRRLAATCDRAVLAARRQVLVDLVGSGIQGRRTLADARTAHAESVAVVDSLRATLTRVEEAPDSPAMVLQGVILRADLVRLEEGAVLATERVHVLEDFERRTAAARATHGDDVRMAREELAIVDDALAIKWQWQVDATLADPDDDVLAMLGPPPDDLAPLLRYREGISIIADARRHGIDGWRLDDYRESLLDGIRAGVGYDPVRQTGPSTAGTDHKVAAAAHEVESTTPTGWHYEHDAAGEPHSRYGSPETPTRFSVPPAVSPAVATETLGLQSEVLDLALSDLDGDGIDLGI
ncbi:MAG TPA: AAA family ATPase, partial [Acidimicrobiales bacterium]|nr:AAA family ATPase [Acidimicrobiales bacterium]